MPEGEMMRARMRAAFEAVREAKNSLRKFGPEASAVLGSLPEIQTLMAEIEQFKREVVARRPDMR
jgi:hypothetical protein